MRATPFALLVAMTLSAPVTAAPRPAPAEQPPVLVTVSTPAHRFSPNVIRMPAGVPVRLVIRNPSGTAHEFRADDFFRGAKLHDGDAHVVDVNRIRVPKYGSVSVRLIAQRGRYPVKSTEPLDAVAGMDGEIQVY